MFPPRPGRKGDLDSLGGFSGKERERSTEFPIGDHKLHAEREAGLSGVVAYDYGHRHEALRRSGRGLDGNHVDAFEVVGFCVFYFEPRARFTAFFGNWNEEAAREVGAGERFFVF